MTTDGGQKYSSHSLFLQNYSWKTIEATIMEIVPGFRNKHTYSSLLLSIVFLYQPF